MNKEQFDVNLVPTGAKVIAFNLSLLKMALSFYTLKA